MHELSRPNHPPIIFLSQKLSECQSEGEGASTSKNLVACPFSVAHSLAFLWNSADEKTADELAKILGFKGRLTKDIVAKLFADYHEDFVECDTLKMGHKVFVNAGAVKVKEDAAAKEVLKSFFVETESATKCLKLSDFVEGVVNKWATAESGQTVDCSSVINLSKKDNDSLRPWILMDQLTFDSPWAIEFPAENTTEQRFWTSESTSVPVQMMQLRETCRYGYMLDLEAAIVELDFDFEDFSILFLVPDSRTGMQEVLKKLQSTNVMYLAAQLRRQDTLVYVPKFKVDVTFALTQELLGKFVSEPDVDSSPLRQSADRLGGLFTATKTAGGDAVEGDALLLHKAVLVVGEKGTEKDKQKIGESLWEFLSTCVSQLVASCSFASVADEDRVPEKFMLDRPFVFLLKYKCNIVLIGHVMEPESS